MLIIVKGMSFLFLTLVLFSLFSLKAPKGDKAMSGLAGAAIASYLVEAIHKYISGDFLNIAFLGEVGTSSGGLAGVAAAKLGIINNAPGTAAPIPGLLATFGFNSPTTVLLALALAAIGGIIGGYAGTSIIMVLDKKYNVMDKIIHNRKSPKPVANH